MWTALALLLLPLQAVDDAVEARPAVPVDEIVVTGPRLLGDPLSLPYRVQQLGAIGDGSNTLPANLGGALSDEPAISVQRTSRGQASPYLRGLTGFRTLTLIDGVRLNQAIYRDGPNQYLALVDPWALSSARVVHGPGSVLYGSDAAGGTVLLESRIATPSEEGRTIEGRLRSRYASAEQSIATRLDAELSTPDFAVRAGGAYRDLDDYRAGAHEGRQANTAYEEWNADLSVAAPITETLEIAGMVQRFDQDDVPRTHSTVFGSSWRGTVPGTDLRRDLDQERELEWLRLRWAPEDQRRIELLVSRHVLEEEENRIRSNSRRRVQGFEDEAWGATLSWNERTDLGTISAGVDWVRESVDSDFIEFNADGTIREIRPRGPVADDADYETLGLYVEDSIPVTERTSISVGGRYTHVSVDANEVDPDPLDADVIAPIDETYSDLVGSIRANHRPNEDLNIFVGVSQAFRAPNLSDLTRFDASRSGEAEIPAPNLDPEHFLTLEVGALYEAGSMSAGGSVWYTILDDLIVRFPTGVVNGDGDAIVTKENSGDGFTTGVELSLDVALDEEWTVGGSFAWVDGKVEQLVAPGVEEHEPLSRLAPARGEIHARYFPAAYDALEFEARFRIADEQGHLSSRDESDIQRIPPGGTPGFVVLDLRMAWEVTPRVRILAEIENVTDRDYRIHGSGQNEPGTNAVLGLDVRF